MTAPPLRGFAACVVRPFLARRVSPPRFAVTRRVVALPPRALMYQGRNARKARARAAVRLRGARVGFLKPAFLVER